MTEANMGNTEQRVVITPEELRQELAALSPPPAYEHSLAYPILSLTDRAFEILMWDLYESQRQSEGHDGSYDAVYVMQGVSERGRDCVLLRKGLAVGLIQCKRYQAAVTKPDAAREIIKFALHSLLDPTLIPESSNFQYIFASASNFNEGALELLSDFNVRMEEESDLDDWIQHVIDQYATFSELKLTNVRSNLLEIFRSINVTPLDSHAINRSIQLHPDLISRFFAVKMVISDDSVAQLKDKVESLLSRLDDDATTRIQTMLGSIPEDRRLEMGIVSLWGYPEDFIMYLSQNQSLHTIIQSVTTVYSTLQNEYLTYLSSRIQEIVFQKIMTPQLMSPFMTQAAGPYLFGRLSNAVQSRMNGRFIAQMMREQSTAMDVMSIKNTLMETGEAYLSRDFSSFVGEGEFLEAKIAMIDFAYNGFASVDEMSQEFDTQWPRVSRILEEIEEELQAELPNTPIVVAEGIGVFDDPDRLKAMLESALRLDSARTGGTQGESDGTGDAE